MNSPISTIELNRVPVTRVTLLLTDPRVSNPHELSAERSRESPLMIALRPLPWVGEAGGVGVDEAVL